MVQAALVNLKMVSRAAAAPAGHDKNKVLLKGCKFHSKGSEVDFYYCDSAC